MIETPDAAKNAHEIAVEADFLSIGTNDLVQYTLALDREQPVASARTAAEPVVLSLIAQVTAAAASAGLDVEVCGEAAGEPPLAALFVGLGVTELSVSPARIDEVRAAVRSLDSVAAAHAAHDALAARSADEAFDLGVRLLSGDRGEERGEVFGGLDGVVA
jgi:phosphoenolpyruvate-protein kinase (PTS system EI component)